LSLSNLENAWANLASQFQSTQNNDQVSMVQTMEDNNYSIDPESGLAVFSQNPTLPDVVSIESEGIINRWADPVTFSLFTEPALLGMSPLFTQPSIDLYEGYQNISPGESNLLITPSNYSVLEEPQQVDFLQSYAPGGYQQALGFTPFQNNSKFTGVQSTGEFPDNNTHFYSNDDYGDFPGPVNMLDKSSTYASGFTLNQEHKDPSLYTGIDETSIPTSWDSTTSLYTGTTPDGPVTFPGPVNFFSDTYVVGFRNNLGNISDNNFDQLNSFTPSGLNFYDILQSRFEDLEAQEFPFSFFGGNNSYYPTLDPEVPGFNINFNNGGYNFSEGEIGDSKFIDIGTGTHTDYHNAGVTFNDTWTYEPNLIPEDGTTWTIPTETPNSPNGFTYQDGTHTKNFIEEIFGEPVDFMTGVNSYHPTLNPEIDGFTLSKNPTDSTVDVPFTSKYNFVNVAGNIIVPEGEEVKIVDSFGAVDFINQYMDGVDNDLGTSNSYYSDTDIDTNFTTNWILDSSLSQGWANADGEIGSSEYVDIDTGTHNRPIHPYSEQISFVAGQTETWPGDNDLYLEQDDVSNYLSQIPVGDGIENIVTNPMTGNLTTMYSVPLSDNENAFFDDTEFAYQLFETQLENGTIANISKGSNAGGAPSVQFNTLYLNNAWNPIVSDSKYVGPIQDGSVIPNSERFNIKSDIHSSGFRSANTSNWKLLELATMQSTWAEKAEEFGLDTPSNAFGGANEPYIVDHVGQEDTNVLAGWNFDGFIPISNIQKDVVRIAKFLSSAAGDQFIINQNLMGSSQLYKTTYDPGSTLVNVAAPKEGFMIPMVNVPRDFGIDGMILDFLLATTYSEYLDNRGEGMGFSNITFGLKRGKTLAELSSKNKPIAHQILDFAAGVETFVGSFVSDSFMSAVDFLTDDPSKPTAKGKSIPSEVAGVTTESGISSKRNMQKTMQSHQRPLGNLGKGDPYTLQPISLTTPKKPSQDGMPFYFRDLRNKAVIMFRAYIEGLSETISPSWSSETYIGRSEPIYTYGNAEREINFTLKIFAQTKDELNQIYVKLNHLTSLCYPEYKKQETITMKDSLGIEQTIKVGNVNDKLRMKPPLTKFRMGDLFGKKGSERAEMSGFIKSLSYNYPDNSPWEIQDGYQVPKYIEAEIGYQVIHSNVPSLSFTQKGRSDDKFYGIVKDEWLT
tara:strand:+ start:3580 stop:7116 length:3537 start_codon:yes stop_codon:yes gene_type:complete